jgi:leucyl aminopeptidase
MNNNIYQLTKIYKKKVDIQVFVLCDNIKNKVEEIFKKLKIDFKIPKTFFDEYKLNKKTTEKRLYFDDYEILFIFVGKTEKCNNKNLYEIYGRLGKKIYDEQKNIQINLFDNDSILQNEIISYILGNYHFNDFKTESEFNLENKDKNKIKNTYFYHPKKKYYSLIEKSIQIANVQNEIRSLINTPANILNSSAYLKHIKNNISQNKNYKDKIKLKVINQEKLKKIGCNLILGVNQGSKNEAMMIILEYKNNDSKVKSKSKPIVLIGKGVMFDSGGYNLKTGDLSDMKNDMTGSAIIYGLLKLLADNNVKGHFIGILPIVENMVDAAAIRPGDILMAYNKKTVEVVDTDAEGRLIIADALAYSKNYNPYLCVDVATLTGQAAQIFGNKSGVIMGTDNKIINNAINSAIECNEKLWELPMWEEYVELTKSNIADYKNHTSTTHASAIMGGAFISNFIPENSKWIHLDIAGPDYLYESTNMRTSGASGEILRTLFTFLQKTN